MRKAEMLTQRHAFVSGGPIRKNNFGLRRLLHKVIALRSGRVLTPLSLVSPFRQDSISALAATRSGRLGTENKVYAGLTTAVALTARVGQPGSSAAAETSTSRSLWN